MISIEVLGFIAAAFTTISFLPQLIQTWKTKSTKDISFGMFLILCSGLLLWLIYGIFINSFPIIIANGATLMIALTILFFKIKYK